MPFFRAGSLNVYFTHIPKCGGTTVERTLDASGIHVNFLDERFGLHETDPWYRSSPQHLTFSDRERLVHAGFFDYDFAIVRDPVRRFLSAFNHHRRAIGVFVSFESFLNQIEKRNKAHDDYFGYRYDNHFVPAARFCSLETEVFALEEGMDACMAKVSEKIGISVEAIHSDNQRDYAFTKTGTPLRKALKQAFASDSPRLSNLSESQLARIEALYAEDYVRLPFYKRATTGEG
ncbi:MAG: sulfotransferase family 2 domain-containing protein [Erythrobacter sp.]|uniref:sulfotransferase family 2 domain-containing protein n=1 Tax=Erythrobacter sp. TaxID=1042 RepID=UPI0032968641